MLTIYHNPRCSKSRAALALLRERGVEPTVVLYLQTPPRAEELRVLTAKLGCGMRDVIRRGEAEYAALGLADDTLSEAKLRAAVAANPKLLERPIAVRGEKAVVGRPPENVLQLL